VVSAIEALAALPQPFTLSEARQTLGTTRRVAVPLLELLDRRRLTQRMDSQLRQIRR
jgi:selenocysteine-specific elongation factor